jgi:hypothetical protein
MTECLWLTELVLFCIISVSKALFVDMSICCLDGNQLCNQSDLQIVVDNSHNKWHCFSMSSSVISQLTIAKQSYARLLLLSSLSSLSSSSSSSSSSSL